MPKTKRHRFQSSREVFNEYIPGYKSQRVGANTTHEEGEPRRAGSELAAELLQKIKGSLVNQKAK